MASAVSCREFLATADPFGVRIISSPVLWVPVSVGHLRLPPLWVNSDLYKLDYLCTSNLINKGRSGPGIGSGFGLCCHQSFLSLFHNCPISPITVCITLQPKNMQISNNDVLMMMLLLIMMLTCMLANCRVHNSGNTSMGFEE